MVPSPLDRVIADDATLSRAQRMLGVIGRKRTKSDGTEASVRITLNTKIDNKVKEQRIIEVSELPIVPDQEEPSRNPFEEEVILVALDVKVARDRFGVPTEVEIQVSTLDTRDLKKTPTGSRGESFAQKIRPGRAIKASSRRASYLDDDDRDVLRRNITQRLEQPWLSANEEFDIDKSDRNIVIVCHDLPKLQEDLGYVGIDLGLQYKVIDVIDVESLAHAASARASWASLLSCEERCPKCVVTTQLTKQSLDDLAFLANCPSEESHVSGRTGVMMQLVIQVIFAGPWIGSDGGEFSVLSRRPKTKTDKVSYVQLAPIYAEGGAVNAETEQMLLKDLDAASDSSTSLESPDIWTPAWTLPSERCSGFSSPIYSSDSVALLHDDHKPHNHYEETFSSNTSWISWEAGQNEYWKAYGCIDRSNRQPRAHQPIIVPPYIAERVRDYTIAKKEFDKHLYETALRFDSVETKQHAFKFFKKVKRTSEDENDSDDSDQDNYRYVPEYAIQQGGYNALARIVRQYCSQKEGSKMMIALSDQIVNRVAVRNWYEARDQVDDEEREENLRHRAIIDTLIEVQEILEH